MSHPDKACVNAHRESTKEEVAMGSSSIGVRDLLRTKGHPVVTVGPDETIVRAIQKLVDNNIGALPVCDTKGALLGIISERDLLKECSQRNRAIGSTKVKDVMTKDVAIGIPDDDLDYVVGIMNRKGIRHLPILDGPKLGGIISMRDIVDTQLKESNAVVRFLSDYISGGYV